MTTGEPDDQRAVARATARGLERIVGELPRGERMLGCLRTAAVLIKQAVDGDRGLRLAESAGYTLREALDAVVEGRSPISGAFPAILKAWDRYQWPGDLTHPRMNDLACLGFAQCNNADSSAKLRPTCQA